MLWTVRPYELIITDNLWWVVNRRRKPTSPCVLMFDFDETTMVLLIGVPILALVIALAIWSARMAAKRRQALRDWSASHNWKYRSEKDFSFDERYPNFACLNEGSKQYAYNIIEGNVDCWPMHAFDYHYETYTTDSKGRRQTHHHRFSAVIFQTDWYLKPLSIRPEHFLDKVTEFFGLDDIDFELEEFSRKFFVKSPDRKWAFDVIHPEMMEFLLAMPRYKIELAARHALVYKASRFSVEEFQKAIELMEGMLKRLPESLIQELQTL